MVKKNTNPTKVTMNAVVPEYSPVSGFRSFWFFSCVCVCPASYLFQNPVRRVEFDYNKRTCSWGSGRKRTECN